MGKQTVNIGSTANDGTGDPIRTAMVRINGNFTEVYNALGGNTVTGLVNAQNEIELLSTANKNKIKIMKCLIRYCNYLSF